MTEQEIARAHMDRIREEEAFAKRKPVHITRRRVFTFAPDEDGLDSYTVWDARRVETGMVAHGSTPSSALTSLRSLMAMEEASRGYQKRLIESACEQPPRPRIVTNMQRNQRV